MNRNRIFQATCVAACLLCVLAAGAGSTTVPEVDLRQMVAASESIVLGRVESSSSRWNEDRSLIVTDVRIRVLDALKGEPGGEVVITQPGGQVGKLRVDVDGAAAYREGDEVILFLNPAPGNERGVYGLFRGRFDVVADSGTGRKTIRSLGAKDAGALRTALRPLGAPGVSTGSASGPMELGDFLGGLREIVRDVEAKGGK